MYKVTQRAGGHVYQQILIWAKLCSSQFIIITRPVWHISLTALHPPPPSLDHLRYRRPVGGNLAGDPPWGWSGCRPCDLFCTHIHMYVPARLYSTPSLLPELPYHLSGKTLSVLAVLPTVSLTDHDQCIATYKCLCVCAVGWVYASRPEGPVFRFNVSLVRSGVIKFRRINRKALALWMTSSDLLPVDTS